MIFIKSDMKLLLKTLWSHFSEKRKKQAIGLILFSIVTSIFEVLTVGSIFNLLSYLTKVNSDDLVEPSTTSNYSELFSNFEFRPENVFIFFIFFIIIACLCRIILLWSMLRFAHTMGSDMGVLMFKKTLQQPLEFHFLNTSSEIISNLTKKIHILSLEIVYPIILVSSNIVIITGVLGFLLFNTGVEVLGVFGLFIFLFYCFWKLSKSRIMLNSRIISENADLLIKIISETLSAIKLISMRQIYNVFTDKFDHTNRKLKFAEGDNVFLSQSIRIWLELILIILGTAFCLISIQIGTFLNILPILGGVVFGVYRIIPLILKAYSGFATIMGAKESFKDIMYYLILEDDSSNKVKKSELITFKREIKISDLYYHYPKKEHPSIYKINTSIKKNTITSILGPTGSGKTTLVSLVAGLLAPSKGSLIIDNIELSEYNIDNWKSKISYVPQETIIIEGSISDNIVLGLDTDIDNNKIKRALKITELAKFIPFINSKEIIGERGVKISGGERQRIGLARAIYDDKEIIILDEPFSALDKNTAQLILSKLKSYKKYTILIVTHNNFVIPFSDKIIKLKDGQLIDSKL